MLGQTTGQQLLAFMAINTVPVSVPACFRWTVVKENFTDCQLRWLSLFITGSMRAAQRAGI